MGAVGYFLLQFGVAAGHVLVLGKQLLLSGLIESGIKDVGHYVQFLVEDKSGSGSLRPGTRSR